MCADEDGFLNRRGAMRRLMIVVMVPIVFSCGGEAPTAPSDTPVFRAPELIGFSPGLVLDLYLPDGGRATGD